VNKPRDGCPQRNELLAEWHEATARFSDAVTEMHKAAGQGQESFIRLMHIAEEARLKAENARLLLEMHRSEHGCF
jgi:hypothetical protein